MQNMIWWERCQPRWLCEGATAENTRGGRREHGRMQRNGACRVQRNDAVLRMR